VPEKASLVKTSCQYYILQCPLVKERTRQKERHEKPELTFFEKYPATQQFSELLLTEEKELYYPI
jgi:hypothetical protein